MYRAGSVRTVAEEISKYELDFAEVQVRCVGEWTILKGILGRWDWIDLTQDRDQWRALLNTVMKIRVP
jgi:hypothetical protein